MNYRSWIKSHEKIYFWSRVFQGSRSKDFRQRVLDITDHPGVARIEILGDKNPDRLFYLIDLDDSGNHSGFFALLNTTVQRLELARRLGAVPYIRWCGTAYGGDAATAAEDNDFTLFFEEPCKDSYDEIRDSQNVVISRTVDGFCREEGQVYHESEGLLKKTAALYARYIRLLPVVSEMIEEEQKKLLVQEEETTLSDMIGIHVRGGDYRVGLKGHPKALTPEDYFGVIDEIDEQAKYKKKIFLATDDERVLKVFLDRYGDRILYYRDVFRTESDLGVHYTFDGRDGHGYYLGLEVLRDMDTLSRCDILIAGVSFVSFTARAWKTARDEKYQIVRILNQGVNQRGITSRDFNRQFNSRQGLNSGSR